MDLLHWGARALAYTGRLDEALEIAESIVYKEDKAIALSSISQALTYIGQQEQALDVLQTAFTTARLAGRKYVFGVLERGAATLKAIDQGLTLWRVYEAVLEVDSWWKTQ